MKKIKHMTPEQIAKIKELFADGMNYYQIAKEMKIPAHVTKYHTERVILGRAHHVRTVIPQAPKTPIQERLEEQMELSPKQKNKILLDFIITHLSVH